MIAYAGAIICFVASAANVAMLVASPNPVSAFAAVVCAGIGVACLAMVRWPS